jgi:predicted TIM-barrel fold metal-dependent hydrolase
MRTIDAFNHFFPKRFFAGVLETPAAQKDMGKRVRGIPALWDLDQRLRIVETFPDYSQILSLSMPAIDRLWKAKDSPKWARIGNDELAEIVARHPRHFRGYAASLPMNAPAEAVKEAERALKNGANAIQLHTNVDGAPIDQDAFLPIYEVIEKSGRPILLHPIRTREMPDYRTETHSKYEINSVIGWPFETGAALARLVFSGIIDRFPNLKIVTHHLGGIIPYFEGRVGHSWDQLGSRTSDEDYTSILKRLKKRPLDYFKAFYGDTALAGARGPTICGISFFTPDRVLFASDCPFDPEKGTGYIRATMDVMQSLDLPDADMKKICYQNAETLFGLIPPQSAR